MAIPILSRVRQRPVELSKDELVKTAIDVAIDPRKLAELPPNQREPVDQVVKSLSVASGYVKKRFSSPGQGTSKPLSAAAIAARAHNVLGPSSSITPVDIALALTEQGLDWIEPFAPGTPLTPFYGYGRRPRQYDYTIGRNVTTETRENRIPFETLEQLYNSYDVARICTRHSINGLRSMRLRYEAMDGYEENPVKEIAEVKKRLRRPDGKRFMKNWLAMNQLNLWKFDSAPIFRLRDRAGNVKKLLNISAKTMAPMLDYFGDFPEPPAPAFQQFIEGVPWNWLTWDDIIYEPFWPETDSPYGTPPLETILINANTDVRLQLYFLQFFTAGSVPEAFAIAPEDMTSGDDIADFEEQYYGYFHGDQSERWGLHWLPNGTELQFYKPQMFDPDLAEYVMRRTVAGYLQTPHNLGFTDNVNRASGDTQMDVQFRIDDLPTCGYYEDLLDSVIQDDWNLPVQVRFDTGGDKEDRVQEAQAHQIYVQMGAESLDEVREKVLGYAVNPEERIPRLIFDERLGVIPLAHVVAISGETDPLTGAPKPGSVKPQPYQLPGGGNPVPAQGPPQGGQPPAGGAGPKVNRDPTKAYPRPLSTGASKEAPSDEPPDERPGWGRDLTSGSPEEDVGYGQLGQAGQGTGTRREGDTNPEMVLQAERDELKKWRANARKAVARGASPRLFADSTLPPGRVARVWAALERASTRQEVDHAFKSAGPEAAGIVVQAEDTGRVLMVQRTPDKHDPKEVYARYEFPGGRLDDDESPWEAASREFTEETGAEIPQLTHVGNWTSPDGVYQGFVVTVPSETDLDLEPDPEEVSSARWWDKSDLDDPKVRDKVTDDLDRVTPMLKGWAAKLSPRSGMVSLDLGDALPVEPSEDVGFHHITIVFLGSDVDDERYAEVCAAAQTLAASTPGPLTGTAGGQGVFPPSESSDWKTPVFVVPHVPGIGGLRGPLERFNGSQHKDFHPHVTVAYVDKGEPLPDLVPETPIRFTHLSVWRGGTVRHFPFKGCEHEIAKSWADTPRDRGGRFSTEHRVQWEQFHRHTDQIIDHYTPMIDAAMAEVFPPDVLRQAVETAYGTAQKAANNPSGRGSGLPPNQATAVVAGGAVGAGAAAGAGVAGVGAAGAAGAGAAGGALGGVAGVGGIALGAIGIGAAIAVLAAARRYLDKLRKVLIDLYGDAYMQGSHEAAQASGGEMPPWTNAVPVPDSYWQTWEPGVGSAATQVAGGALAELLRQRNIWIKEMTDTEVDRIGDAITQGIEQGFPVKQVTEAVDQIVHDEKRARLIAETEFARASGAAAMETYRLNNVPELDWLAEPTACVLCKENEAASPQPTLHPHWPNGGIPVHPHERCAVAPRVRVPGRS